MKGSQVLPSAFSFCRRPGAKFFDQGVDFVVGHPAAHLVIVDEHDGRIATSPETLPFLQGEKAIGRGATKAHAEFVLKISRGVLPERKAQGRFVHRVSL